VHCKLHLDSHSFDIPTGRDLIYPMKQMSLKTNMASEKNILATASKALKPGHWQLISFKVSMYKLRCIVK